MLLEMEEEVLIVDIGEEVGVHNEYSVVIEGIHKLYAADGAEELRLSEGAYLNAFTWSSEMFFKLLAKVVDGYVDMLHSIRNKAVDIMVDDALTPYFK